MIDRLGCDSSVMEKKGIAKAEYSGYGISLVRSQAAMSLV